MNKNTEFSQRLVRGTPVVIADSFGVAGLRSAKQVVASKGPVKCNGKGRCAGDWCIGLAVFTTSPDTINEDKSLGWRSGTAKVCLTHIKDSEGRLVLPPPAIRVAQSALEKVGPRTESTSSDPVTWQELAQTASESNWVHLVALARRLKRENEVLSQTVIKLQGSLLERLAQA